MSRKRRYRRIKPLDPRPKRRSWLRDPQPLRPQRALIEQTLLSLYGHGTGSRKPWDQPARRYRRVAKILKKLGLVERVRLVSSYRAVTSRNRDALTPQGRQVVWDGELPITKPVPRSQRREKRSRHV